MSRFMWKMVGGLFPFILILMGLAASHPYGGIAVVAIAVMWANACGFIEGHLRKVQP